jgi:primosomal protein N' (replication factor Y) (superfamily II helicase)
MWVIRCIVIAQISPPTELSYFSPERIEEGSVIGISLRGKGAYGLVTRTSPLADEKQDLKESAFELHKLKDPKPRKLFSRSFLRALFIAANEEACTPGSLLSHMTPSAVLKRRADMSEISEGDARAVGYEPLVLTQGRRDRIAEYKRLSREALARGVSLSIICPTITEVLRIGEEISHGIEEYVEVLHSELTEKKYAAAWQKILEKKTPSIIVGTLSALSIPRADIATIILERAATSFYDSNTRPYVRGARVAEEIAKASGARFILSGVIPSIEVAHRKAEGQVADYGISTIHIGGPSPLVVDLKAVKFEKGKYSPLSPLALETIRRFRTEGKRVLVVAARRGLAPLTVCDDCGTTLTCGVCSATLVLHKENGPMFVCHQCGTEESASVRCRVCAGWRLTTLGISVDRVAEALVKEFGDDQVLTLSADTGSRKEAQRRAARWSGKSAGILVATERAIPYLPDLIPLVVVASVDTYLGIPEYSASERAAIFLAELRTRSEDTFVLQSRNLSHRVMKAIMEGMVISLYKEELRDRERFGYPPFTTLVRLTLQGRSERTGAEAAEYLRALEPLSPVLLEGRAPRRGLLRLHIMLRLPRGRWVDQRLLRFIRLLPPSVEARIDPRNIHTG